MRRDPRSRGAGLPRNVVAHHDAVSYGHAPTAIGNFVGRGGLRDGWAGAPGLEAGAVAQLEWMRSRMMGASVESGDCGCGSGSAPGSGGCGCDVAGQSPVDSRPTRRGRPAAPPRPRGETVRSSVGPDGMVTVVSRATPSGPRRTPRASGRQPLRPNPRTPEQGERSSLHSPELPPPGLPPPRPGLDLPPYPHPDPTGYDSGGQGLPPVPPTPVPEWQPEGVVFQPPPPPPNDVTGWNPSYPPTPIPPPGSVVADCEIVLPPGVDPEVDPSIPTGPGGVTPEGSPAEAGVSFGFGTSPGPQAAPYPVPPSLEAPPKPLCPPLYTYDYDWQSCWPDDDPPPGPPPQPYQHACRCPPGESWLVDEWECWTHGDPMLAVGDTVPLPPDLSGGEQECNSGFEWDDLEQQCVFVGCEEGENFSPLDLECKLNICPSTDGVGIDWQHYHGDCVDGWDDYYFDRVNEALHGAVEYLDPARRFLAELLYLHEEGFDDWVEYYWNFGFGSVEDSSPEPDRPWDPSLVRWFGPFHPVILRLAYDIVNWALIRITEPPGIHIRCHNLDSSCSGAAYSTAASSASHVGTIHLCPRWSHENTPVERVWYIIHELFHFAFPIANPHTALQITNMPHDVKDSNLCDSGDSSVCYRQVDAASLADHLEETRIILDNSGIIGHVPAPAAWSNVDNYTSWVFSRFIAWGPCLYPHGALTSLGLGLDSRQLSNPWAG